MNTFHTLAFYALSTAAVSAATNETVQKLTPLVVHETPSVADKYLLPQATESVTAIRAEEKINAFDAEDVVKYLPSIFLRKRNYGDTQAVLASRVWGVSSSARSLVYADGVLLSALIANNNTLGAPRWGLVSPTEVERIDLMYGPFAAAYPGNSMGAVVEITTRQPDRLVMSLTQTEALQAFRQYGTRDIFLTHQTAVAIGNRSGRFSYWVSANYQDSHSQPLAYVTAAAFPAGARGGFTASNKFNAPANVLGAAGLLHSQMSNAKLKLVYDVTPSLRLAYTFGVWTNETNSTVETYLTNAAGAPTFAGLAGFASGNYALNEQHTSHSLSLKTDTKGPWDFEVVGSRYRFDTSSQRSPSSASPTDAPAPSFGRAGRVASLGGTGWTTLDLKATWRLQLAAEERATHVLSFGLHDDRYRLLNPTYTTADWERGAPYTGIATAGNGKTHTRAAWLQDVWALQSNFKLTLGARYEDWRAYDGYNVNGTVAVRQPNVSASNVSPKATLAWSVTSQWRLSVSVAQAYRYATAAELYQLVSTGLTFIAPNPDLKPDDVRATELKLERRFAEGSARLSVFQDDIHDAITSQFKPLAPGSTQLFSYLSNVDHVRARGVEAVVEQHNVGIHGLDFSANVTYLNARTLALSGAASATTPPGGAVGKRLPNIPEWRAAFLVSYRPTTRWTLTAGGRYSSLLYTTLDNTDVNPNTYQGFSGWFVADLRAHCRINDRCAVAIGIDNVFNREYFLFHPFPQRAFVADLKITF